ncbi:MAG: hypothetical protein Q6373_006365 [Candidatus Sigynarchaeota archaeon]
MSARSPDVSPNVIDAPARQPPLTMRRKIVYVCTFFAGVFFSNPPLMPASIACAAILLLQSRNKKVAILGIMLVVLQIVVISVFLELMINAGRGTP